MTNTSEVGLSTQCGAQNWFSHAPTDIVQVLQDLYDELKTYQAPRVVHPDLGLSAVLPPKLSIVRASLGMKC